tara:strand:+ start:137 stop:346 length:210 start_codon:yes stop_codon:yes gene_type:complete
MKITGTSNEWPKEMKKQHHKKERDEMDDFRCSDFFLIDGRWTWCNDDGWESHLGSPDGGPCCSFCGEKV